MNWSGKIGVSPAFFISRFGTAFTLDDIMDSSGDIASLGFNSLQLEVFETAALVSWTRSKGLLLKELLAEKGLQVSQFVAHYLMGWVSDYIPSFDGELPENIAPFLEVFNLFEGKKLLTLPVGPASVNYSAAEYPYAVRYGQLVEKLALLGRKCEEAGGLLCLEMTPGSLLQGSDGFRRLQGEQKLVNLGLNWDTGHHHFIGEPLDLIPSKLGTAIQGTHLCDNDGVINRSNPPGEGTIVWAPLLKQLIGSGYAGSLDLEIICDPQDVLKVYGKARIDLLTRLEQAGLTCPDEIKK